ncbi:GNAT family N-acetyltransferase [Halorussus aquaticus]|uniref:GNAT family N-acetyltransferase n=1 Tax=Halorussus aquaticus TaxID=2953748 RepID=A0ABD5Q3B0_9EURY|nr:GNAT family N-acetyltransferase [Halorussus aquaticus]
MASEHPLRPAKPSDTEAILVVHVAAIIAHGPSAYTDEQVAAWAAKPEGTDRYTNAIEDSSTELVVAETDGRVVGFGKLDVERGEVEAVFVDPERNGEGIGSAILNHFEQRLRDEGFEVVRLRAVLNAVGFYERQGYERVARVTNTTTNDVDVDSVWLEKSL